MTEEKKPESDATIFPEANDPTPHQLKAMGAVEIPADPAQARLRLTRDFPTVFYWTPKPQSWLDRKLGANEPPHGRRNTDNSLMICRPWDECGLVIQDPKIWPDGLVILRYCDGVELLISVDDLHKGWKFSVNEIRRKFVPVHPGEKDMAGIFHKKGT